MGLRKNVNGIIINWLSNDIYIINIQNLVIIILYSNINLILNINLFNIYIF